ncbi:hypothetical protein B0H14DRAFT_2636734 [Mycena olivaceomarginata]|nr:hypothetical protein B0H14DRAFT_2636734 [Mycena olivaceomarginata]
MYDIEIFGYAVERFTDHVHIWGGSPVFHKANKLYPGAIQPDLFDWKARIRNAVMERLRQAEGSGTEDSSTVALHIDCTRIPLWGAGTGQPGGFTGRVDWVQAAGCSQAQPAATRTRPTGFLTKD